LATEYWQSRNKLKFGQQHWYLTVCHDNNQHNQKPTNHE
jgi:hypothetical protein